MADMWSYLQPLFAHNEIEDQPSDVMRRRGNPAGYDYAAWWDAMQAAGPRSTYVPQIAPDGYYHWPSPFKANAHPSRVLFLDGQLIDTKEGRVIPNRNRLLELQGW